MKSVTPILNSHQAEQLGYPPVLQEACTRSGRFRIRFKDSSFLFCLKAEPISREWIRLFVIEDDMDDFHDAIVEARMDSILFALEDDE